MNNEIKEEAGSDKIKTRPSRDSVVRAFKRMDGIFMMAAIHGDNTPDQDIIELFKWLRREYDIEGSK